MTGARLRAARNPSPAAIGVRILKDLAEPQSITRPHPKGFTVVREACFTLKQAETNMRIPAICLLGLIASTAFTSPTEAESTASSVSGFPVCQAPGNRQKPKLVVDASGTSIVTWEDGRAGASSDIYAHRLLATGEADPVWPVDGLSVCSAVNRQAEPSIASDGAGGAIVVWYDLRNGGDYDIYAHHVLPTGGLDPLWPANGLVICSAPGNQYILALVQDGSGGAVACWWDYRGGTTSDIYAQHILGSGAVDPAWPAGGRALCQAAGSQEYAKAVSDGAGGAIAVWQDTRSGAVTAVYAQHVLGSGLVDPAWPADGRAVAVNSWNDFGPVLVADGAGGAIVAWYTSALGSFSNSDVYAHRVLSSGALDGAWPAGGRALCTAPRDQSGATIASDGNGGAIVTWEDARGALNVDDIYAQHVRSTGQVDPAWPAGGRGVCGADGYQWWPQIAADGAGGALICWFDVRAAFGVYAHHVASNGVPDPLWPWGGLMVSTNRPVTTPPVLAANEGGQAIVLWLTLADATPTYHLYAARVTPDTPTPALVSTVSSDWTGVEAELVWFCGGLSNAVVTIYREVDGTGWSAVAAATVDGEGFVRHADRSVLSGHRYGYRIGFHADGVELFAGETSITIPEGRLAIQRVAPNPVRGERLGLRATFAGTGPARARVLDLSGRVVLERDVATSSGGAELELGGAPLRPGVYVLELVQGNARATARFTYLN